MLKPGFVLNRQLLAIANSLQSNKTSVKFSAFYRRQYYLYSDKSASEWASTTMSSKDKKKPKLSDSESASSSSSSDSDSSPPPRKDAKSKSKPASDPVESSTAKTNSLRVAGEKEPTWELGSKKFITIGDFKGKTYINIREYYTDGKGEVKPGKKGIGLNVEQWQNLCGAIEEVNKVLKK